MGAPSKADLLKLVETQRQRIEEQDKEIKLLRQKIDALARRIFGKSSEKLDPNQLEFLFALQDGDLDPGKSPASSGDRLIDEEADSEGAGKARKRRPFARRERLPADLPVVEELIEPREVLEEPAAWRHIDDEVSDQIDYEPGRFLLRRLIRRKYVRRAPCEEETAFAIAPLPPSLQERCIAAPGLLAQIVVGKFCDHLPLYRQEYIFESRYGVHLSRQNMARWMGLVADWLRPVYDVIRTGVLAGGYVQVDETPIRYLDPGHGQTRQGYLWTTCRPYGDVFYRWETSRAGKCLERIIPAEFDGTLQCDGYAGYGSFARTRSEPITLAGCWAHVRRRFYEALEQGGLYAGFILRQFQHLYRIEEELREHRAGPRLRQARRAAQSAPIIERIRNVLLGLKATRRFLPRSAMGQAIDYALEIWDSLLVYLVDGRVEIDNNMVENAIRPTAIGKKNWLFVGEADAGQRAAIIFTIIECCRRHDIDPYSYLRDVLTRLPAMTNWQVKDITPAAWANARQRAAA
jgi:transposase